MDPRVLDYGLKFFQGSWKWKFTLQINFLQCRGLQFLYGFLKLGSQDQTESCASVSIRCGGWIQHALQEVPA